METITRAAVACAVSVAAALAIVLTIQAFTADAIKKNERENYERHIRALIIAPDDTPLPAAVTLSNSNITLSATTLRAAYPIYENAALSGIIIEADARDGYNGAIRLLFAYALPVSSSSEPRIRVIRHAETPGISDFLNQADNFAISDIDGISGATITTRAINKSEREIRAALPRILKLLNAT